MKKRELGSTSLQVSEIAFGGVEIGMPYGIGVKDEKDMPTENDAIKLLHAAADAGVNFFDTARLYGNSERIIGKAFSDRRSSVLISTKCRQFRDKDGKLPDDAELKRIIETSLAESLRELKSDYVDLYMLHQADLEILSNETIARFFENLKKKGIARSVGASTYRNAETEKVITSATWDVVQLPFNLMDQRQAQLFPLAEHHKKGIVVRSVLLRGLLSNRAGDLHPALKHVRDHIESYDQLIGGTISDRSSLAIKFALSFPAVSTALVGIDRLEYLAHAKAAADGNYFGTSMLERARDLAFPDPTFIDLPHWERMGWLT